jgi:hypothetical protein
VPPGQLDPTVEPSVEVLADAVDPLPLSRLRVTAFPMKGNTAEFLLAACILFMWRHGCPKIFDSD